MVGGDKGALERVRPVLNAMGNPEKVVYIGESGAGQICKVCNQMAIGGALAVVSEAFALARKAGVDAARVREAAAALAPGGGYIVASVHCIQPDVSPENVLAMYDPALRALTA